MLYGIVKFLGDSLVQEANYYINGKKLLKVKKNNIVSYTYVHTQFSHTDSGIIHGFAVISS